MPEIHTTYCRNCPSVCGLRVSVEGNKVTEIRGDPKHPLTAGYFCVKGLASMDLHNGEDRVTRPRARLTNGAWREIEFDRALDEIHFRLDSILSQHGPRAVAMHYGTGANNNSLCHSAMKSWMHAVGSPFIFSSMTLDQSAKWVTAGRMGIFATGKYSALDADVLMEVGCNPAISHTSSTIPMTNPMRWLREARRRGTRLIVVDPRLTETARQADLHLPIRPGEDAALFAGMIRLVIDRELYDQNFCEQFTSGFAELRQAVEPFDLATVSRRTDVDSHLIAQAAEMFARARRKSGGSGTGPDMANNSNVASHLLEAFNAICGGYRRAGDVVRNVQPLFGRSVPMEMVIPPYRSWEHGPKCRTADIGPLFGEYPSSLIPQEIEGDGDDRIRALIVVGGNPAKAIGDPHRTLPALQSLELLVTLDPRLTETAALSHYMIPTSLPYERHDYTGMYDGYFAKSFAHVARPILNRPPEVIDDWEFFWGLAQRMKVPLELKFPTFGATHAQIQEAGLSLDMERKPTTEDLVAWMCSRHAAPSDLIDNHHGVLSSAEVPVQPADPSRDARLSLCPKDVAGEIEQYRHRNASSASFPYLLVVRRQLESMNSAYSRASRTRQRFPVNPLFMHPDDMAELQISDHQSVLMASETERSALSSGLTWG